MAKAVDLYIIYQLLRRLTTPFDETDAYELGIIDEKGKLIKKPQTKEEKDAYDLVDRFVFNIKRLIEKVPGGRTRLGSYAAALLLIRERHEIEQIVDNDYLIEQAWKENVRYLKKEMPMKLNEMVDEDAPSTSTAGVAGLTPSDLKVSPSAHKKYKERNKAQANTVGRKVMSLKTFTEERQITKSDLDQIEKYADKLFAKVGIDVNFTRHFLDRVNDERNKKQITTAELTRLFKQSYAKHGKKISNMNPDAEAVLKDMKTDVNMPFVLKYDPKNQEIDLVAKTVMRKKGFKTPDPEFTVEMLKYEGSKWVLYSKDGSKKLGEFDTKEDALKRERQIQYFKHKG
jgi:hypothetical protein